MPGILSSNDLLAELTATATQLTSDDIVERVRPTTATSTLRVVDILDAVHADRR